jgi:hypothetical protein
MKKILTSLLMAVLLVPTAFAAFSDVNSTTLYNQDIEWLANNNVIQGYPDGTFGPDKCVKRAELLKMIYELKDKELSNDTRSNFKDTEVGQWYIPYVNTAKEEGTVQGYSDGTFKPGQCVNRAEALKIAQNAYIKGYTPEKFQREICDVHDTDWFSNYVHFGLTKRTVGGEHTTQGDCGGIDFHPESDMTRKEVATMLFRLKTMTDLNWTGMSDQKPTKGSLYNNPIPYTPLIATISDSDGQIAKLRWSDEYNQADKYGIKKYEVQIECLDCLGISSDEGNETQIVEVNHYDYGMRIDGSKYRYRVRGVDSIGTKGIWSRYIEFPTVGTIMTDPL